MKDLKTRIFQPFVFSSVTGALIAIAALILTSAAVYILQLPVEICGTLALISLSCGCFGGGYALGKRKRRHGLKQGFLCGSALFLLCLLGGLIFGTVSAAGIVRRLIVCITAGAIGGVIGANREI